MMFKNPGQQSQFYMVALLYCSTQECKPEKVTSRELQKWAYLVTGAKIPYVLCICSSIQILPHGSDLVDPTLREC